MYKKHPHKRIKRLIFGLNTGIICIKGLVMENTFQRSDAYDNRRDERKETGTWIHV